ncbi:hypothetical protein AB837_00610 [bacterium AB1]|nr:hypothetical protein AB837_00610 [bacterium AB1]
MVLGDTLVEQQIKFDIDLLEHILQENQHELNKNLEKNNKVQKLLIQIKQNVDSISTLTQDYGVIDIQEDGVLLLDQQVVPIDSLVETFDSIAFGSKSYFLNLSNYLLLQNIDGLLDAYKAKKKILDRECLESLMSSINSNIFHLSTFQILNIDELLIIMSHINQKIINIQKEYLQNFKSKTLCILYDSFNKQYLQHKSLIDKIRNSLSQINTIISDFTKEKSSDFSLNQLIENQRYINSTINSMIFSKQYYPALEKKNNCLLISGDNWTQLDFYDKNVYLCFFKDKQNVQLLHEHQAQKMELYHFLLLTTSNYLNAIYCHINNNNEELLEKLEKQMQILRVSLESNKTEYYEFIAKQQEIFKKLLEEHTVICCCQ